MGIPKLLTTDQGSEFKNRVNDEMMQLLKIKHRLTTAYHPQVVHTLLLLLGVLLRVWEQDYLPLYFTNH